MHSACEVNAVFDSSSQFRTGRSCIFCADGQMDRRIELITLLLAHARGVTMVSHSNMVVAAGYTASSMVYCTLQGVGLASLTPEHVRGQSLTRCKIA